MRLRRVLHVLHAPWGVPEAGGTERYAEALAAGQAARGLEVARFSPAELPPGARPRGAFAELDAPGVDAAFSAVLRAGRPEVVHVHHLSGLSLRIPALARAAGAGVVLTLHDAWLRCARGQLVDGQGRRCPGPEVSRCARCLAPELRAPVPAPLARRLPPASARVRAREAAVTEALGAVHRLLATSAHLPARLGLEAEVLPAPATRDLPPTPPPAEGPLRLLFVGSLLPTKGPDVLLDAFRRLPAGAAELVVVGPALPWQGSRRWAERLTARIAATPGASWRGPVSHAELPRLYGEADLFVFPSTWIENSPFVLREAVAAGLRVVAADVPGARELAPGARFVAPGDVGALAAALAAELRAPRVRRAGGGEDRGAGARAEPTAERATAGPSRGEVAPGRAVAGAGPAGPGVGIGGAFAAHVSAVLDRYPVPPGATGTACATDDPRKEVV